MDTNPNPNSNPNRYMCDPVKRELWSAIVDRNKTITFRIPYGVGLAGWVAENETFVNIVDVYEDERFNYDVDRRKRLPLTLTLNIDVDTNVRGCVMRMRATGTA